NGSFVLAEARRVGGREVAAALRDRRARARRAPRRAQRRARRTPPRRPPPPPRGPAPVRTARRIRSRNSMSRPAALRRTDVGDAAQGREEALPHGALRGQCLATGGREAIAAAPGVPGLLEPPALDEPLALHPVERGIEGGDVERDLAARALLDQAG